ncbi:hypothetical protein SDC9_180459 [bioreactor metagenome]|uniref:Uncharacterized protein n=1 Tax=bioreactor metagenome TaxID=1076179 RepID=A0A645H3B4_9ZZZZ
MDLVWLGFHPLSVFPILALLGYLAYIDFRIEVGCECFAVITRITVYDIEIVDLIETMFDGIRGKDTCHTGVESATKNGCQSGFLELLLIGPLPSVLELGFIFRLIIGCIEIMYATFETGIHNGQILIGQRNINHQFGLIFIE